MNLIINITITAWDTLGEMAPYLLFGFFMAGALSIVLSPGIVERHLGKGGFGSIFKASLFGVPLPLCSCSVIPVATSLRKHGASEGATTAFLLSTPQTGVDSIMATFSLLGPVFAIFRPLAAFITGILGGTIVEATAPRAEASEEPEACTDSCCSHESKKDPWPKRLIRYGFVTIPRDIGGPLMLGLLIAGLISAVVPPHLVADKLGQGIGSMLVMMLLGIPVYVCATASIPIAAAMIMHQGISAGAALVFLLTGPATNAATIAALWKVLGRRTTLIYLGIVATTALLSGLTLDFLFDINNATVSHIHSEMTPPWLRHSSAAILLILLGGAFLSKHIHRKRHSHSEHDDCCKE